MVMFASSPHVESLEKVKGTHLLIPLLFMLVLTLGIATASGEGVDETMQQFLSDTRGSAQVRINPATGVAKFVRLQATGPDVSPGATPAARANAFFARYGAIFGIKNAPNELHMIGVAVSPILTHVSYQQMYKGVPVFAGVLRASFNREDRLVAVNGVFLPALTIRPTPRWSDLEAAEIALRHVQGADTALTLRAVHTTLYIFRSGLLKGVPGSNHLVWEVEVVNPKLTIREFVYVDAHFGKIVDQITGIHEALDREVSETTLDNVVWTEGDDDPIPAGWADGSPQQAVDWQDEIDGAREIYNLFGSMSNGAYLSYDGTMAQMRTVNNDPGILCPNANWNGTSTNYCSGVTSDDVVAHEWGHAFTASTNNLIYQWQSGALNESYSDIWGETVDLLNDRGTDTPGDLRTADACSSYGAGPKKNDNTYRWLLGEDSSAFGGAIRDMWRPTCYNDPGKVSDTGQYICSTADSGGVHANSGIPNHAYALMVDGGTYNGITVSALGFTRAARLQWEAQNLLGPASDFVDNADALDTACAALIGATLYELDTQRPTGVASEQFISAADCTAVAAATAAVEMRTPPTQCDFQPLLAPNAPVVCAGTGTYDIHVQDWENGLGSWTVGTREVVNASTFDTPDWALMSPLPDSREGKAAFVEDAIIGDCQTDNEAGVLYLQSPPIMVPADATPQLVFDHWVATESGWDGGNVKISVNGGSFNLVPSGSFVFNAYNGILYTLLGYPSINNPLAEEPAFTGTDGGSVGGSWGQSQIDLAGLVNPGDTIQVRFEMGLDGCNGLVGWYVDDVRIYSCGDPSSCGDGICEGQPYEDCTSCPADCPSLPFSGALCGNHVCEAGDGENCETCPVDCNGKQSGRPSDRFCCGDGGGQNPIMCTHDDGTVCNAQGFSCTSVPGSGSVGYCCGDSVCEGDENSMSCEVDCSRPDNETDCEDAIDNDSDGSVDCADADCSSDPACQTICVDLGQAGDPCQGDAACCSGNCKGQPGHKTCK